MSTATSKAASNVTTDHDEIRRWAEDRKAKPACVKGTGNSGDIGMIRLDFPGYSGESSLEHIAWDEWFEKFDENNLALLYQETTASGDKSNFNKIISRDTAEEHDRHDKHQGGSSKKHHESEATKPKAKAKKT